VTESQSAAQIRESPSDSQLGGANAEHPRSAHRGAMRTPRSVSEGSGSRS